MGVFQFFTDFFESIFMSSSPEVKKKQELRAIENKLKEIQPVIFKGGMVQPNFAEAFHILYTNVKPIYEILASTLFTEDLQRNWKFEEQLILTGFDSEGQQLVKSLLYENRKADVIASGDKMYEVQKARLKKIVKEFNTPAFAMIQNVIDRLHQIFDLCKYNYINVVRVFDPSFIADNELYKPVFQQVLPVKLESALLDLYYLSSELEITSSVGNAIVALAVLHAHNQNISANDRQHIFMYLEKISAVFKQVLTPDVLKSLIRLAKREPTFEPKVASYKSSALQKYASHLEERFVADETRIKTEIKDELISSELVTLFGSENAPLLNLNVYNMESNEKFQGCCNASFTYVIPLQIVKTFIKEFYSDNIKSLLNDIVIEGFFGNPAYKSEFSALIYSCNDAMAQVDRFENNFVRGGAFDEGVMLNLINNSRKDPEYEKQLVQFINKANNTAKEVIQKETSMFYSLYNQVDSLLMELKKPSPESISNLKVLMLSSRHRDNTMLLEKQKEQWRAFLEIMRNYVVVAEVKKIS